MTRAAEAPPPTLGRVTHHTERRVSGPSPYGGEWDHGWRRQSAKVAAAHARSMISDHVPWARVQERIVETEIVDEQILR